MLVRFHADDIEVKGTDDQKEWKLVCDLIDMMTLELDVFPQNGQKLNFVIGDYSLDAEVDYNYINYYEPGNDNIKEAYWGINYDVYLKYLEIVECFKR